MFDNFTATGIVVSLVSSFLLITMLRRMFPSQFYNEIIFVRAICHGLANNTYSTFKLDLTKALKNAITIEKCVVAINKHAVGCGFVAWSVEHRRLVVESGFVAWSVEHHRLVVEKMKAALSMPLWTDPFSDASSKIIERPYRRSNMSLSAKADVGNVIQTALLWKGDRAYITASTVVRKLAKGRSVLVNCIVSTPVTTIQLELPENSDANWVYDLTRFNDGVHNGYLDNQGRFHLVFMCKDDTPAVELQAMEYEVIEVIDDEAFDKLQTMATNKNFEICDYCAETFYNIKATDGKDILLLSDQAAYINNRDQELGNSLITVLVDCVEMPTVSGVSIMVHAGAKIDWHYKFPVWNHKHSVESEPA